MTVKNIVNFHLEEKKNYDNKIPMLPTFVSSHQLAYLLSAKEGKRLVHIRTMFCILYVLVVYECFKVLGTFMYHFKNILCVHTMIHLH